MLSGKPSWLLLLRLYQQEELVSIHSQATGPKETQKFQFIEAEVVWPKETQKFQFIEAEVVWGIICVYFK